MNSNELHGLIRQYSHIIITPDGVGSKGDEAMISGCLGFLQGQKALLVTPNRNQWSDALVGRTHLFEECSVPLEKMPELFQYPRFLIVIGADTMDGSCGYEAAHWRLETIRAAVNNGGKAVVFCSMRSDMDQRLVQEWKSLPESVSVFLRDSITEENYSNQVGRQAQRFSDLAFFSKAIQTERVKKFCEKLSQIGQKKQIIGLQMSETMFRSFNTELTNEKRRAFAWQTAALAVSGLSPKDTCILLLTHDTRSWSEHWSDYQYACAAAERLSGVEGFDYLLQPPQLTQAELLHVLPFCDILICGRMHMSITSCCAGVVPLVVAGVGKNYVMVDKVRGMCREWLGSDRNLILSMEEIPTLRDEILATNDFRDALEAKRFSLKDTLPIEHKNMSDILGVRPVEWNEAFAQETALIKALDRAAEFHRELAEEETVCLKREAHIELLLQSERNLMGEKAQLQNALGCAEGEIQQLREKENVLSGRLSNAENEVQQLRDKENSLKGMLSNAENEVQQLRDKENSLKGMLSAAENKVQQLRNNEDVLKIERDVLGNRVAQYSNQLSRLKESEEELRRTLLCTEGERNQLRDKENQLLQTISLKDEEYAHVQYELACRDAECQQLLDKENQLKADLEATRNSRTWRLARVFASFVRFFVPVASKRALIFRLLWTFIKHPFKFLKNLTPRKLKKFFRMLRQGNIEGIKLLINSNITGQPAPSMIEVSVPDVVPVEMGPVREKTAADYSVIQVPQWENPQVSIIIPVYNQFEFTYHCVESIIKNSGGITYEIIIANDCSTDLTTQIDDILPGVNCITNEKNLRFLLNCNNAAKRAKGQYVLFLNNDTQVQPNWLEPLVTLIESADDIGMVGSKLIYPDGLLQEAGGILWKDGSAWNFGNRQNPALPQFNYVKQVDYISGAAIMLSRELWEEIGGFDETFVPAYCEDSDLAFTVRKMGYRVMYQPLSVVVHFEGVSNGTDTSSGQKHYQVVNSKKFREKWAEELEKHPENAENVFQARDYSFGKKTLLMVDHYVPHFDKDAGSRTVYQYLKLFVNAGFNVKFIGDNFYQHEPYTTALQQMGIEVLYGPECAQHWKDWIRENAEHFDYVFLNRPHIAPKYLEFIRENTNAKIMYYGHDLAFLREMREYEITGDASFRDSSIEWKPKEIALMKAADMAYYPSYVEVDEIHAIDPSVKVKAIPAYLFENVTWKGYDFENREDIMFIGGFGHRPNVDAVKWVAEEILPELLKYLPDVKIHILGSNTPKEVLDLANDHLIMEGFVTDEQLEWFYRNMRISLVPLRYGAGIKGKVVEAMRFGTPVVTTSTGAEGIPDAEKAMLIEDDAKQLAKRLAELYSDAARLASMSENCIEYIQNNYSPSNAISIIGPEFDLS